MLGMYRLFFCLCRYSSATSFHFLLTVNIKAQLVNYLLIVHFFIIIDIMIHLISLDCVYFQLNCISHPVLERYTLYIELFSLLVVKASGTFYPLSTLPTEHIQKSSEYKNNITGTKVLTFCSANGLMLNHLNCKIMDILFQKLRNS